MSTMHTTVGTVTGPHHLSKGEDNQDRVLQTTHNGLTLIAVSDGAGSLKNSGLGADIALQAAETALHEIDEVSDDSAIYIVEQARAAVLEQDDHELGCTLALCLTDMSSWAVAGIGDSFAVVQANGALIHFSSAPNEYANITQLLTSVDVDVWAFDGSDIQAAAVCSDGLEHKTLVNQEPHEGFWGDIFNRVSNGLEIQDVLEFMNAKEMLDDDTTTAILSITEDAEIDE